MAAAKRKQVIISPQAKLDLESIILYLKENWSQKVLDNFLLKIETFCTIVSINPHVFGYYVRAGISEIMQLPNSMLFITGTRERLLK